MLGRIIRDFIQLRRALKRYYRRRARGPFTPEQEVARLMRELRYRREMARRLSGRR